MRPSESRASRVLTVRLRQRAHEAGLPSYAPVAGAVTVGLAALKGGADLDEAGEAGWAYLQIWAHRWPAPTTAGRWPTDVPSIRLAPRLVATPAAG